MGCPGAAESYGERHLWQEEKWGEVPRKRRGRRRLRRGAAGAGPEPPSGRQSPEKHAVPRYTYPPFEPRHCNSCQHLVDPLLPRAVRLDALQYAAVTPRSAAAGVATKP